MPMMQVHGLQDKTIPPYPKPQAPRNRTVSWNKWYYTPIRDSARVFAARNCDIPVPQPRPSKVPLGSDDESWTQNDIDGNQRKVSNQVLFDEEDLYSTQFDGVDGLRCHYTRAFTEGRESRCSLNSKGEVITCLWHGGHTWPTSNYSAQLIWPFFLRHPRGKIA